MNGQSRGSSRVSSVSGALPSQLNAARSQVLICLVAVGIYITVILLGNPDHLQSAGLGFALELVLWAIAGLTLTSRSKGIVVSSIGFIIFLWGTGYFILPSAYWLLGFKLPFNEILETDLMAEVFVVQGCFLLAFVVGYSMFTISRNTDGRQVPTKRLPNGWILVIASILLFLLIEGILRFAVLGTVLPSQVDYGRWNLEVYYSSVQFRNSNGIAYVLFQFYSQFQFLLTLTLGAGIGLIFAVSLRTKQHTWRNMLFLSAIMLVFLLLSTGARSKLILPLILGLVFADMIAGPIRIRWTYIVLIVLGLVFTDYFAQYRKYMDRPIVEAVQAGWHDFTNLSDSSRLVELNLMLTKNVVFRSMLEKGLVESSVVDYVSFHLLAYVPSQLNPAKLTYKQTETLLSDYVYNLYLPGYYLQIDDEHPTAGLAGSMIAEGYRLGGFLGVIILGIISGLISCAIEKVLIGGASKRATMLSLLLYAGWFTISYRVIRSAPNQLVTEFLYYVVLPRLLFALVMQHRRTFWNTPFAELSNSSSTLETRITPYSPQAKLSSLGSEAVNNR